MNHTHDHDIRRAVFFERWWDRMIRGAAVPLDSSLDIGLEGFARRVHALDEQRERA